jgi:Sortase and related acyltransferases
VGRVTSNHGGGVSTDRGYGREMVTALRARSATLRSGHVVRIRQVRPADAPALARAYADLGEQSRYRRFFTVMPELPEATRAAASQVDHDRHEALVAVPPRSGEIVGEARFVRSPDLPDVADVAVTVVDSWQGRGLGTLLLQHLSRRASEAGVHYFPAEVLAENGPMLHMLLPGIGRVETARAGPVVNARIEVPESGR